MKRVVEKVAEFAQISRCVSTFNPNFAATKNTSKPVTRICPSNSSSKPSGKSVALSEENLDNSDIDYDYDYDDDDDDGDDDDETRADILTDLLAEADKWDRRGIAKEFAKKTREVLKSCREEGAEYGMSRVGGSGCDAAYSWFASMLQDFVDQALAAVAEGSRVGGIDANPPTNSLHSESMHSDSDRSTSRRATIGGCRELSADPHGYHRFPHAQGYHQAQSQSFVRHTGGGGRGGGDGDKSGSSDECGFSYINNNNFRRRSAGDTRAGTSADQYGSAGSSAGRGSSPSQPSGQDKVSVELTDARFNT